MDVEVNKTAHGFMVSTRAPLGKRSLGALPCGAGALGRRSVYRPVIRRWAF
jgi:hypothetical protein